MNAIKHLLNDLAQVTRWPTRSAEKTAVAEYLAAKFQAGQSYNGTQIKTLLNAWHTFEDWALLCSELCERGFLTPETNSSGYVRTALGPSDPGHRLKLENIQQAARSIDPVFLNTPQFSAETLSQVLGVELVVKVETLNPIRSFKGRGAEYFFVRNPSLKEVICASAGNFGQGMAYAARKRGVKPTVFASINANPLKVARMQALGAEVHLVGEDFDAAKLAAKAYAAERSLTFVEDGKDVEFSEGAGTMGLELLRYPKPFDALLIPLGNGAMLAGIARWVKAQAPEIRLVGVSAAGAPAMERSWRSGTLVQAPSIATIADGIGVRLPIPEALEDLEGLIDEVLLVEDATILQAMRLVHQHLGLVLEPSGAVGIAALLTHTQFKGRRVATVLCGGNLTEEQMKLWL
ncbi:pyridoxal-phosphate dependent enzyme [Meiothermus hypogaeus]|uniref:Threonine dehydratase n=2 Tax=Meiothermus hypogaeus TaxID=884155 RepID=A0A511R166_9DEIN|nr:pyridoxal-phosphate dependent enzyme [Meiothermus hypogaeus]RIH80618.1 L-threonine ammonia-lyase [Meiothermus hypogaeus]GEM83345.1 threonine dehydratase [Meiothermus hypogaeus NBRC 106114]